MCIYIYIWLFHPNTGVPQNIPSNCGHCGFGQSFGLHSQKGSWFQLAARSQILDWSFWFTSWYFSGQFSKLYFSRHSSSVPSFSHQISHPFTIIFHHFVPGPGPEGPCTIGPVPGGREAASENQGELQSLGPLVGKWWYICICIWITRLYVISFILVDIVCKFVVSIRTGISLSLDPCDFGHSHRWLLPAFLRHPAAKELVSHEAKNRLKTAYQIHDFPTILGGICHINWCGRISGNQLEKLDNPLKSGTETLKWMVYHVWLDTSYIALIEIHALLSFLGSNYKADICKSNVYHTVIGNVYHVYHIVIGTVYFLPSSKWT